MSYGWNSDTGSSGGTGFKSQSDDGFASARKAYQKQSRSNRSRNTNSASGRSAAYSGTNYGAPQTPPPIGKDIQTESTHPLTVVQDVTGSMGTWPGIIFEKLPLLGGEVARYAPEYAISFAAIGDGLYAPHEYALQIRDFASGEPLDEHVRMLGTEGSNDTNDESYGLVPYYYLHHCHIPNAVKPILILICDAAYHMKVSKEEIKRWTGDDVESDMDTFELFQQLKEKFTVYVLLRGGYDEANVSDLWKKTVGEENVIPISEPRDVVEMIIGIYAGEMGMFDDFSKRSSGRHSDRLDRVSRVSKSLHSVSAKSAKMASASGDPNAGKSVRSGGKSGKSMRSRSLV